MKKQISLIIVICLLVSIFPNMAFASVPANLENKSNYQIYTAIGDSICAGFTQLDYEYIRGFDIMDNIHNSPKLCYARLVGKAMGSTVNNLGKCGCTSDELLNIITDPNNKYYDVYRKHIAESNLITLEIGSNDLIMATVHSILKCIGGDFSNMSNQDILALAEPLLTGDIPGIKNNIKQVTGIDLNQEQIKAIQTALSDEALSVTLEKAYENYSCNFPKISDEIRTINPMAEIVILNYYNPFKGMNLSWGNISYNTGDVIQKSTDQMNEFTRNLCQNKDYLYIDISDTFTNIIDAHPSTVGHAQIAAKITDGLLNIVTAFAQFGGTITPFGINTVKNRSTITFSISANPGYMISDVLVDGKSVGSVNTYTFTDIRDNHLILAKSKRASASY